jgi:hypothetical protein
VNSNPDEETGRKGTRKCVVTLDRETQRIYREHYAQNRQG